MQIYKNILQNVLTNMDENCIMKSTKEKERNKTTREKVVKSQEGRCKEID